MKTFAKTPARCLLSLLCSGMCLNGAESGTATANAEQSKPVLTLEAQCAAPFADKAVFQQNIPLPVWGTSLPGAKVAITFDQQAKTTVADKDGKWRVTLDPIPADKLVSVNEAPAGRSLTVVTEQGGEKATRVLNHILVGEVWLCSGQSNMAGPLRMDPYPPGTVAQANYPALRKQAGGEWIISSPETAGKFSRVAFCFARDVQRELLVPVGLLIAATAGSPIESWMQHPPASPARPAQEGVGGGNYEAHIKPLVGYAMRGVIWYQGEGNPDEGREYFLKMQSLIGDWRKSWGQGDFSFYFVQLASIGSSPADKPEGGDGRARIRNAQIEALTLKNTGMAVAIDIGAPKEHPRNTYDVGIRLARWALNKDYGRQDVVPSGPLYKGFKIEGNKIRVLFDHAQNGLMLARKEGYEPPVPTPGAKIPWLSVRAKDGMWHWADGVIEGAELLVSSKAVVEPVAVRYAYTQNPVGFNLYNKEGLPASPFSTCGYGTTVKIGQKKDKK